MIPSIVMPALVLIGLTSIVWTIMYVQRLRFLFANRIPPDRLATPELVSSVIPERINRPSNNLKNLFELPVIFYFLCCAAVVLAPNDPMLAKLAWTFVLLRIVHSAIHCTVNIVAYRFAAYFASSLVLWAMAGRFAFLCLHTG